MPIGLGEPHGQWRIAADKLKPLIRYKYGTDSRTEEHVQSSPYVLAPKISCASRARSRCSEPSSVRTTRLKSSTRRREIQVIFHWTNAERAEDETHGFAISQHDVNLSLEPGKTASATIQNVKSGVYPYYCTEFCSALHLEMEGYLMVAPKGASVKTVALELRPELH